ncbi:hypothetical protein [Sphingorhabdus sp. Alg239-R122]|uniref:hypothetical protein n=1 Tax=Sphingorhabdus sp. Alg239-R122 TaxID=2305989 RepID=UPI0013DBEA0A|nr:hypothetical protein [Sphingorhabdus sp. Alg239-R122]
MTEYEFYEGSWAYRSLHDDPDIQKPFNDLRFGAGIITFGQIAYDQILDGKLDMGGGYELLLRGELLRNTGGIVGIRWTGTGVVGTDTEGWVYDYHGERTHEWPGATDQADVIVGSVIRTVAHGDSPAGYAATFYMVKQADG